MEQKIKTEPIVITTSLVKGGVGKSTVMQNIAAALNKIYNITILDLDHKQLHLHKFSMNREEPFKEQWISNPDELVSYLEKQKEGIFLLDIGGFDTTFQRTAIYLSDLVILPLDDGDNEQDSLSEFVDDMKSILEERDSIKFKVLVNKIHHADKATHRAYSEFLSDVDNFNIYDTVLPLNKSYKRQTSSGKAVFEITSGTPGILTERFIEEVKKDIKEINNG